jgi:hypothetical protein
MGKTKPPPIGLLFTDYGLDLVCPCSRCRLFLPSEGRYDSEYGQKKSDTFHLVRIVVLADIHFFPNDACNLSLQSSSTKADVDHLSFHRHRLLFDTATRVGRFLVDGRSLILVNFASLQSTIVRATKACEKLNSDPFLTISSKSTIGFCASVDWPARSARFSGEMRQHSVVEANARTVFNNT